MPISSWSDFSAFLNVIFWFPFIWKEDSFNVTLMHHENQSMGSGAKWEIGFKIALMVFLNQNANLDTPLLAISLTLPEWLTFHCCSVLWSDYYHFPLTCNIVNTPGLSTFRAKVQTCNFVKFKMTGILEAPKQTSSAIWGLPASPASI